MEGFKTKKGIERRFSKRTSRNGLPTKKTVHKGLQINDQKGKIKYIIQIMVNAHHREGISTPITTGLFDNRIANTKDALLRT